MVVLYDDSVGDENERITLQFPGDVVGSSPRQITTRRVGSQTIVFNTPGKHRFCLERICAHFANTIAYV